MRELDDQFAQYCMLAIQTAADELKVDPMKLARRLNDAEIARLVLLLNAALRHVENAGLRHRIEDLLGFVSDGRMPGEAAESELDWALKVSARRRSAEARRVPEPEENDS